MYAVFLMKNPFCTSHEKRARKPSGLEDLRTWATGELARLLSGLRIVGECWEWTGAMRDNGYGRFGRGSAHRAAYVFLVGRIGAGLQVCHRCDNRLCCNPAHLFLGTAKDNALDAKVKGRTNGGKPSRPNYPQETLDLVVRLSASMRRSDIARLAGMTERNVYDILRRARSGAFRPRGRQPHRQPCGGVT